MSDVIRLLPDSVANQIAAGEVIQRPSSVIKELVENAVDAGATSINIVITDAGKTCIQVIDNGKGMSVTDARMAFERHATSKIRMASDLFALHTMGFRGEALASIAAVAQVELRTRTEDEEVGTSIVIEGSQVKSQEPVACPKGSNFMVKNLFYNVPARRKFLKSDHTELSNILAEMERIMLVNPGISFTMRHNGNDLYSYLPSTTKKRIVDIFGRKTGQQLLHIAVTTQLATIDGFIGTPASSRKKAQQFFFVNGRYMRHPYFNKAVMEAYDKIIPAGEQVPYFIYFTVDPASIDVNIHPTKTEIKFENEQSIWQILLSAVREGIAHSSSVPAIDFDTNTMHERSIPLGGAMIEDVMLRLACRRSGHGKGDLMEYEQEKVKIRKSKEAFYSSYLNVRDMAEPSMVLASHLVSFRDGRDERLELTPDFMTAVTRDNRVAYSTDECPLVEGTWEGLYESFLAACKAEWLDMKQCADFEGIVLLTGGASQMFFIQDIARKVFPNARVLLDAEPSYCVSRGLAYAVRTDLEAFRLIHEAKQQIAAAVKDDVPALKRMIGEELTPVVYRHVERKLRAWKTDGEGISLDKIMKQTNEDFLKECGQEVRSVTQQAFVSYLNRTGDKGIKALIVKTVNELFESLFPGRLNERSIDRFSIGKDEWDTIVSMLSTEDSLNVGDVLIDRLDLEPTIARALKNNFLVVLALGIPALILAGIVDRIFSTKWADKVDKVFTENRYKVCSREEREKIYNNLVNNREQNRTLITDSLSMSCILPENEQKIADSIVTCLEPAIDRAVDNVSLYF